MISSILLAFIVVRPRILSAVSSEADQREKIALALATTFFVGLQ
jgi:hypothetical protein